IRVQTMLMEILLWPTVSITSARVGLAGSFTGTSAAVPVTAPVGSGPLGSAGAATGAADAGDSAGVGAASVGAAEGAGAGSWAWVVTERRPHTASPSARPKTKLRARRLRVSLFKANSPFWRAWAGRPSRRRRAARPDVETKARNRERTVIAP